MFKFATILGITLAVILFSGAPASAVDTATALKVLDPDNDGTIDMKEAVKGAKSVFKAINPDNDRTLDAAELRGRLSAAGLRAADPDDDGTLSWKEYKALVKGMFRAANPDMDGTIDLRELSSPAGQRLLKLIYL